MTSAVSATVTADSDGRPIIHLEIPAELWEPNPGIEHPNNHRSFGGTLVINGVLTHLEAIQVEQDKDGIQHPNSAEYREEIDALGTLAGDGAFDTSITVDPGQEFVIYAYPYC